MRGRLNEPLGSPRTSRVVAAVAASFSALVLLGCLGLGLQVGPLGLHVGSGEPERPPKPPPPPPAPTHPKKKATTLTEEPDGTLRQEGQVSVPARATTSLYYLRPFGGTPHLEVSEPDEDGLHFLLTEQEPDHFTVRNTGLLGDRTFTWTAHGIRPALLPSLVAPK